MLRVIEALSLPPASALMFFLLGLALARRWRRAGRGLMAFVLVWLWVASTPLFGGALLRALQGHAPLPAAGELPGADAIVVLSASADTEAPEYGRPVAGAMTLQRLRYGAALQRRTGLPLCVSGGIPAVGAPSLATMMRDAAEQEFGVPVRWVEERSADTSENARFSAELLRRDGVKTVMLVSSAWHLPRAAACFHREGLEVVAAPTAFRGAALDGWRSFVPSWQGLQDTCLALHEWGGRIVYALRG